MLCVWIFAAFGRRLVGDTCALGLDDGQFTICAGRQEEQGGGQQDQCGAHGDSSHKGEDSYSRNWASCDLRRTGDARRAGCDNLALWCCVDASVCRGQFFLMGLDEVLKLLLSLLLDLGKVGVGGDVASDLVVALELGLGTGGANDDAGAVGEVVD